MKNKDLGEPPGVEIGRRWDLPPVFIRKMQRQRTQQFKSRNKMKCWAVINLESRSIEDLVGGCQLFWRFFRSFPRISRDLPDLSDSSVHTVVTSAGRRRG